MPVANVFFQRETSSRGDASGWSPVSNDHTMFKYHISRQHDPEHERGRSLAYTHLETYMMPMMCLTLTI